MPDRYLHIRNWDKFQHYKGRNQIWLKDHVSQLHDDDCRNLPFAVSGLLERLRLLYAAKMQRGLSDDTATLSRELGQRVLRVHLDRLIHEGFLLVSASKTLAPRYQAASTDKEGEVLRTSPKSDASAEAPKGRASAASPETTKAKERAETWIRNGAADEIPADSLADYIEGDFKIHDPDIVADLVHQAQERR